MCQNPHKVSKALFEIGDVLFLEHQIPDIPYPSGYWVLMSLTDVQATVSLLGENSAGLCPTGATYNIPREDLPAFSKTKEHIPPGQMGPSSTGS